MLPLKCDWDPDGSCLVCGIETPWQSYAEDESEGEPLCWDCAQDISDAQQEKIRAKAVMVQAGAARVAREQEAEHGLEGALKLAHARSEEEFQPQTMWRRVAKVLSQR